MLFLMAEASVSQRKETPWWLWSYILVWAPQQHILLGYSLSNPFIHWTTQPKLSQCSVDKWVWHSQTKCVISDCYISPYSSLGMCTCFMGKLVCIHCLHQADLSGRYVYRTTCVKLYIHCTVFPGIQHSSLFSCLLRDEWINYSFSSVLSHHFAVRERDNLLYYTFKRSVLSDHLTTQLPRPLMRSSVVKWFDALP